ncbi:MAG: UDP-2,3-diacylglucosamine diphosphatase [Rhodothermales bacterium]
MRVRTIWISDLHLGSRYARAADVLDFIRTWECEHLYLVGDIFDGWALTRSWFWPQEHNDVVQKILRYSRKGTPITYIPGNHDAFAREFLDLQLGNIRVEPSAVHTLMDGRRLLVLHGDEFDGIIRFAPWLQRVGAVAYGIALGLNEVLNRIRTMLDKPYWSLSAYLKHRTKKALQYIDQFEELVAEKARTHGVDGVVCGHIHHAEMRDIDGVSYMNCGDWVESCTALVEHLDGRLEIVRHMAEPTTGTSRSIERDPNQIEMFYEGDGLPANVAKPIPTP